MNISDLSNRIVGLIRFGEEVLNSQPGEDSAESTLFFQFRASSIAFLKDAFGDRHIYPTEFDRLVMTVYKYEVKHGLGVLKAAKDEIDGQWIFTTRGLISGEIFTDLLQQAKHLLESQYKDAAAVIIGGVLEEHLRYLCQKPTINISLNKTLGNGRIEPKSAGDLNNDLRSNNAISILDNQANTAWIAIRNKAAHGNYGDYTKEQVQNMFSGVSDFLSRHQ